jgi:hypothetical protein
MFSRVKRLILTAVALFAAASAIAVTAQASYDVIPCGRSDNGSYLYAANDSTSCSFVHATLRAVNRRKSRSGLTAHFSLHVRGIGLRCRHIVGSNYEEVRCKGHSHKVIIYHR